MAHPFVWAMRIIHAFEDRIVAAILRRPGFHRGVGRIHKFIDEKQNGRLPHEPLAPGEATADPDAPDRARSFVKHFFDELRNQARGKPTDIDKPPYK
ncbi:hypothetical protein ISF_07024 [Cordyceps fumosorosea ARSEF 2679]|uniref:Uncharacterized protein n=1 Tax=Cordyceps fumosorosea (strain ARSEF 2679) TaxID=1081104 RepID=A0A167QMT8_CORFA|nr:hypothetical protein ISF_07024 [Cordyceps fumosorosea ARSEF 2679]OAA57783.1 hypothetical protein ISF_07024 [Cordyceps fumosorosea ARSEF 2679]